MGRFINADSYASTGQGIIGNNMFAYCNNNPVIFSDASGNSPFNQLMCLHDDLGGGYSYIKDQNAITVGTKKLGLATVSHSGCGPVAVYNALVSMADFTSFNEVLLYFNQNFTQMTFGGLAGMTPDLVAQYFKDHGYTVYMTDDPYEMDIYSLSADANILWYMFPATYEPLGINVDAFGAHFVEYSRNGAGYTGRNTAEGNGSYSFTYPSDYAYKGGRYYAIGIYIFK